MEKIDYRKVYKFLDAIEVKEVKFQTKRPKHRVVRSKDAKGKANSEDTDQTAV